MGKDDLSNVFGCMKCGERLTVTDVVCGKCAQAGEVPESELADMIKRTATAMPAIKLEVSANRAHASASGDKPLPWSIEADLPYGPDRIEGCRPGGNDAWCTVEVDGRIVAEITVHDTGIEKDYTTEVQAVCAALVWSGLRSALWRRSLNEENQDD